MTDNNFSAFTLKAEGRARNIISPISVSWPKANYSFAVSDSPFNTKALWDTGATSSVITKGTAFALGLKPITQTKVGQANGHYTANVYMVDIHLPNRITINNVKVTECADTGGDFGVIIGMDIITLGDFSITNVGGKSVVSYRFPSIQEIDYVVEHQKNSLKNGSISLNQKCPCGSGKSYKNCHGKNLKKKF